MAILETTHWRDAARNPRFYFMDALAAFPILLFLMHMSFKTLGISAFFITFFIGLERFKFTIPVFFRWLRATIAGPVRTSRPWWKT